MGSLSRVSDAGQPPLVGISSGRAQSGGEHIGPVIMPCRRPGAVDLEVRPGISFQSALVRGPPGRIPVEQEHQPFETVGQEDMRGALGAQRGPDRKPVQPHGSKRGLDPFGETQNIVCGGKLDRAATGTSQHHARIGQVVRESE